ncbi:MAG: tetratricopeptide repeat protein, partial [Candidatus Obscuribacterales bacterium]|nr:tetratricopeptide repeat protein [Candidatus Obscuribacterales bacterium]
MHDTQIDRSWLKTGPRNLIKFVFKISFCLVLSGSAIFCGVAFARQKKTEIPPVNRPARKVESAECKKTIAEATRLFAQKKSIAAIELLQSSEKTCAGCDRFYVLLSSILLRQRGSQQKAAQAASMAVSLNPQSQAANMQLGVSLMAAGKTAEAAKAFSDLTNLAPTSYEAWSALTSIYTDLGENEKAKTCANKAACLEPESREARLRTIKSLSQQGKLTSAKQELKQLIADDELEPEFFIILAQTAEDIGAHKEALEATSRVLNQYPDNQEVLSTRSQASYFSRDYQAALESASRLSDDNQKAVAIRALCLIKLGKAKEAGTLLD